jgi:hypothetical protein
MIREDEAVDVTDEPKKTIADLARARLIATFELLMAFLLGLLWYSQRDRIPTWAQVTAGLVALVAIVAVLKALDSRKSTLQRRLYAVGVGLMIVAIGLLVYGRATVDLKASLFWYQIDAQGNPVINHEEFKMNQQGNPLLNYEDFQTFRSGQRLKDRIEIPITLAALNITDRPLRDVTVEIHYPREFKVVPQGKQRLDPKRGVLIYEHTLDTLKVHGAAVLLPNTDTDRLVFRITRYRFRRISDEHGIPVEVQTDYAHYGPSNTARTQQGGHPIPLDITLFSEGKPIVSRTLTVILSNFTFYTYMQPTGPAERIEPNRALSDGVIGASAGGKVLKGRLRYNSIDTRGHGNAVPIEYRAFQVAHARLELIFLNGIPRRLIVDADANGKRDYDLWDTDGDGLFDLKLSYSPKKQLKPWTRGMLTGTFFDPLDDTVLDLTK